MGKAGASRTGVADMEGIPTPMPVGLLNRVQSLELKLEEVSQKCCRLEQENCSLRTWVQELQKGLKSAQKSFAAVEDLQQEVALMNADVASPKSSDSTGSRRGVMFRQRESIVEIDGRLANGNSFGDEPASRKVKSRKPTGYVAQTAKAAVGFEEYDEDVEEVEVEKTPKRKVHGRTPTAFVPKKGASPDVDFDDDAEDIEVEEEVAGPKRTVHGRKATAFVPKAKAPNVDFENEAEDVEEVEVDNTPHRKVKGRQPTAFVPKAPSHSAVDFRDNAEEFEGEETSDGAPKRAVHGRKATAFVKKSKVVGVEFEDEDEDVEEVEVETTPKRSVHGRQPTAFVPKSKARAGQVGFNDGAETVETEEDEETGPKRSTHGRKPTAFVPKSRAAPGVSFDDGAGQVEVEQEGEMPTRSAHGRKPTAFVPKSQGVGFAADDDREAKAPVPKLPLKTPDGDGEDMSSPSKRGVRFRGNDSVNELDDHGEAHGHAVRKRVPTKFVAEAKVKEEDEDEHAHVSFADEVSESDEDGDEITSTPKLRPSRARVPTAFEKAYVPVEDDGSLTHEELQELNKRADQRPARPRLPTAFTQTGVAEAVQCLSPRMEDMVKSMPEHMKEIVDAGEGVDLQKHQLQGATKDVAFAEGILRKLLYFKDVDDLTIQKLIQAMEVFRFPDKTQVTRQGSIRGTHFFIVSKGSLVVLRNGEVKSEISQGAAFGENVILMSGGQDTTVQAKGEVEVYGLSGLRTRSLLAEQYQRERGQASSAVNEALSCESCWLLRKLTPYQMQCLFDKVNVQSYEDGAVLLTPGHKEHQDLHIILQGQVALSEAVRGDEVAMVERMGVIGYTGILYKEETFTAIAKGPVQTLILSSTLLQQMFGTSLEETIIRSRILMSIRQQEDLQHLRMDQLDGLASLYELVNVKPGETIERPCFRLGFSLRGQVKASLIKEGKEIREPVILKDRGKVLIPEDADIEADKSPLLRLSLAAGEAKNAKVAVWSGRTVAVFLEVVRRKKRLSASPDISPMSQSSEARQRSPSMRLAVLSDDKVGALRKVVVFRTLAPEQLHRLAEALEVVNKKPGEIIFNQGDSGKEFYIIHTGLLEVSIGGKKVRSLGMGDYVGERALLYSEPRSATVKVVEECELWRMGHEEFNQAVEGPICEYMKARIELQNTKVDLNSLTCLRVIGRGGFGVVKMVQSKTSGTRYALKCVSKKQAVEQKQQKALAHERDILAELDHPFIIKFVRSFNGPRFVYFLTELVTGGELLDALDALGLLQAPQAQFYSASIILAIEFLHERRIAYLDLKGENCLIDQHGYLKIIDFGVAERITDGRIYAVKGTPLFMAPEVILGKGYTTAADLWSLGVCLFDFMVGSFPFGDDQASNAEIFKAVLKAPLKFPKWLGVHEKDAKELMKQLLCRDPAKRLGAGQRGYDELKEHPFYADFRWDQLLSRQLKPPFTPQGETYAEDAEGGKDAEPGVLSVTEEDRAGEDDWEDPDPSWADEF